MAKQPIDNRHRCEVRQILKFRAESQERATDYLTAVEKRRGKEAATKLREDCTTQWQRGNRGDWGIWR